MCNQYFSLSKDPDRKIWKLYIKNKNKIENKLILFYKILKDIVEL